MLPTKTNYTMKTFSKIKFQSRADLVVDKISYSVINGELSDGELLPPESKLCETFGVSRSILREAIRVLASKGLVEVKQGHGTFVRRPRIDVTEEAVSNYLRTHSFSLFQLMEVRTPIEVEVAKLAAERREQMHLNSMEESLQVMSVDSNNVDVFSDGDRDFHQAIIDASGNRLFAIMIRSIMGYLHINRQLGIRHFGIQVVFQEHERVFEAIKNQQPSVAAIKMKEHMAQTLMRINKVEELLKRQK
jgi:GntR family transcriptional repressor for pyruvate dehydrogenase complex